MQTLEPATIDCVITDVPYGTTSCSWDAIIPFEAMWEQLARITKPRAPIILFGSQPFTSAMIMSNPKWFKHSLVWEKSKCGSPLLAKYRPMMKHEDILVFSVKGKPYTYFPQMEAGEPYSRKWTEHKANNHQYGITGVAHENLGTRHPSSVRKVAQKWRRQDQVHPTQKPVELMEWLVRSYCPEEGTVLDFTMGSGSTGVGCVLANRSFVGIERDEKYFDIAKERIDAGK